MAFRAWAERWRYLGGHHRRRPLPWKNEATVLWREPTVILQWKKCSEPSDNPSSRHRRLDPLKAQLGYIRCIDEGIDHANRIAFVNPVIEAFRQQRQLLPIRPCNEALHQFPRRTIRRILAALTFLHMG